MLTKLYYIKGTTMHEHHLKNLQELCEQYPRQSFEFIVNLYLNSSQYRLPNETYLVHKNIYEEK